MSGILLPRLADDEVSVAFHHGVDRRMKKITGQRGDRAQLKRSSVENDLEGSGAELALNKYYGTYPEGYSGLRAPDCPLGLEARWTGRADGRLIIYQDDCDDRRYVLIDGFAPQYRVLGWLWGKDGKLAKWWDKEWGCYLVPRTVLHPGLPTLQEIWEQRVLAEKNFRPRVVAAR